MKRLKSLIKYVWLIPILSCILTSGVLLFMFNTAKEIALISACEDAKTYLDISTEELELTLGVGYIDYSAEKHTFFDYWLKWDFNLVNESFPCVYGFAFVNIDSQLVDINKYHSEIMRDISHPLHNHVKLIKKTTKCMELDLEKKPKYLIQGFDLLDNKEFISAINKNRSGNITIPFIIEDINDRIILYYKWVSNKDYLCVVGVVPELLEESLPIAISIIVIVAILLTVVLNFWMIYVINKYNDKLQDCKKCQINSTMKL